MPPCEDTQLYTNTATISALWDTTNDNNTDIATGTCVDRPWDNPWTWDLGITKSDGWVEIYTWGNQLTYTFVVTNYGPSAITGLWITDNTWTVFENFSVTWSCTSQGVLGFSFGVLNTVLRLSGAQINSGGTITCTITGTIKDTSNCTGLYNQVSLSITGDVTDYNNTGLATGTCAGAQDYNLVINKTPDGATHLSGDTVTWIITYLNDSSVSIPSVVIEDVLPTNFTYQSSDPTYTSLGWWVYTRSIGTLAPGQTGIILITGLIFGNSGDVLVNTATIYSTDPAFPSTGETNTGDNDNTWRVEIIDDDGTTPWTWDLEITKSDGLVTLYTGWSALSFTITVTNNGPYAATGVLVTDFLGHIFWFNPVSVSCDNGSTGSYNTLTQTFSASINQLNATQSFVCQLSSTVSTGVDCPPQMLFVNTGVVTSVSTDIDPTNNTDIATGFAVTGTCVDRPWDNPWTWDLEITKSDGWVEIYTWGSILSYTITVYNHGPNAVTGAYLTDDLSSVFDTGVVLLYSCYTWGNGILGRSFSYTNNLLFDISAHQINSGSRISCVMTGTIKDTSSCTDLINIATGYSTSVDTNLSNNIGIATGSCPTSSTTGSTGSFDLIVDKQFLNYQSGIATFVLSVFNSGDSIRTGIDIQDVFSTWLSRSGVVTYNNFINTGSLTIVSSNEVWFEDLSLASNTTGQIVIQMLVQSWSSVLGVNNVFVPYHSWEQITWLCKPLIHQYQCISGSLSTTTSYGSCQAINNSAGNTSASWSTSVTGPMGTYILFPTGVSCSWYAWPAGSSGGCDCIGWYLACASYVPWSWNQNCPVCNNADSDAVCTTPTTSWWAAIWIIKSLSSTGILLSNEQNPWSLVTYTLTYYNSGSTLATGVFVRDVVPAVLQSVSVTGAYLLYTPGLGFAIGDLYPGESRTITISWLIPASFTGSILNTTWITSTTPDTSPDDNTGKVITVVWLTGDFLLYKCVYSSGSACVPSLSPTVGAPVWYKITLVSKQALTDVWVADVISLTNLFTGNTLYYTITANGVAIAAGVYTPGTTTWFMIWSVVAGTVYEITLEGTLTRSCQQYTNTATVTLGSRVYSSSATISIKWCDTPGGSMCGDNTLNTNEQCEASIPSSITTWYTCVACKLIPITGTPWNPWNPWSPPSIPSTPWNPWSRPWNQQWFTKCGNGKLEVGEYCDEWVAWWPIYEGTYRWNVCTISCTLQYSTGNNPPKCAYIDPPSIVVGEYMPYRRWLEVDQTRFTDQACTVNNIGKIQKWSLKCVFSVFNAKSGRSRDQWETSNAVLQFEKDCGEYQDYASASSRLFNVFNTPSRDAYGRSYLTPSDTLKFTDYGEYKMELTQVKYNMCRSNNNGSGYAFQVQPYDRICQYNFVVTKPYMIQKWSTVSTTLDSNLDDFYAFDDVGTNIFRMFQGNTTSIASFTNSANLTYIREKFVNKYLKLAVKYDMSSQMQGKTSYGSIAKVPGKEIYVFDGKDKRAQITIRNLSNMAKPYTIIVKNGDLFITDNVDGNGMFVVPDGKIYFKTTQCQKTQTVKGIFIAQGFDTFYTNAFDDYDPIINNDLGKPRCDQWSLKVKGTLVGWGISTVMQKRRSRLWQRRAIPSNTNISKTRYNQIINGASLSIEPAPSLWMNTPPGANELSSVINIYKQ